MSKAKKQQQASKIVDIEVLFISKSKTNPRKSFDKESIQELADSMNQFGLLQPITVRPDGDCFELVAGERRLRAAELLKWERIPSIVRNVSDDEVLEIQILENLQREDVSPMDEANAFHSLLKKESLDWLTSRIHKSKKYVSDRLKLTNLNKVGQELLSMNRLPLSHAVLISKLDPAEQIKALDNCFPYVGFEDDDTNSFDEDDICKCTYDDLKEFIDDSFIYLAKAPFNTEDTLLNQDAGACTDCPFRTTNQQLLFNDITEEDKCTKKSCFDQKTKAHIEQRLKFAKNLYKDAKLATIDFNGSVKVGGQTIRQYETDPGKDLTPVIINKVDRFGRNEDLGKVVYVNLKEKEQTAAKNNRREEDHSKQAAEDYNKNIVPRLTAYLKHVKPKSHLLEDDALRMVLAKNLMMENIDHLVACANHLNIEVGVQNQDVYALTQKMNYDARQVMKKEVITKLLADLDVKMLVQVYLICTTIDEYDELEYDEDADAEIHNITLKKVYGCSGFNDQPMEVA